MKEDLKRIKIQMSLEKAIEVGLINKKEAGEIIEHDKKLIREEELVDKTAEWIKNTIDAEILKDAGKEIEYNKINYAELKLHKFTIGSKAVPRWVRLKWMDSAEFSEVLELDLKEFPLGTKVTVHTPVCPKCKLMAHFCKQLTYCDFDWDKWIFNKFNKE